jgi:hypothetical protein
MPIAKKWVDGEIYTWLCHINIIEIRLTFNVLAKEEKWLIT